MLLTVHISPSLPSLEWGIEPRDPVILRAFPSAPPALNCSAGNRRAKTQASSGHVHEVHC